MICKKATTLIFAVFTFLIARSQFNDSVFHYVNYAATGIINKTNNGKSYVLTNALKYNINKKSIRLNSSNSWLYGQQGNRLTNNDFNSILDFNLYKANSRYYYWGLANFDKSYSLKINYRLQTGLGMAYNFVNTSTAFFNLSDGILYENSSLKINDSTKNYYSIMRNSFRLRYRFVINQIITVDGINFLQSSLSDGDDYIIKASNTVSFKLRKWLNLNAAATYNRNQVTRSENLLITFGLSAEKYF